MSVANIIGEMSINIHNQSYENTKECSFCMYTFLNDYPHYTCTMRQGCRLNVCQACFIRWASGQIKSDNTGFTVLSCRCGNEIDYNVIKSIFPEDDFAKYDNALTRFALEREKNIIYCPGKDCPNIFIKPKLKKNKRQCRKTTCDNCETSFCCMCGDLYTEDHAKMKCGPYKKWKHENDKETIALDKFIKSEQSKGYIKPCPKCKRNVEKKGGCSDMKCTNCDTRFCWICLYIKNTASCFKCAQAALDPIPLVTVSISPPIQIPSTTISANTSKGVKRSGPRRNAARACKIKKI